MSKERKRWEPSQEDFDKLLSSLHPDREQAGIEYQALRLRLTTYFEQRNCAEADWLADVVINRVIKRLAEGETIHELIRYSYGVAKWVLVEHKKKTLRYGGSLEDLPPIPVEPVDLTKAEFSSAQLNYCLQQLPENDRVLLLQYLCQDEMKNKQARKKLADSLAVSPLALRLRVYRLKARVAECLTSRFNFREKN
jgi:hypothetical protein